MIRASLFPTDRAAWWLVYLHRRTLHRGASPEVPSTVHYRQCTILAASIQSCASLVSKIPWNNQAITAVIFSLSKKNMCLICERVSEFKFHEKGNVNAFGVFFSFNFSSQIISPYKCEPRLKDRFTTMFSGMRSGLL